MPERHDYCVYDMEVDTVHLILMVTIFFKEMCVDIFFLKSFLKKLLHHLCVNLERERERERERYEKLSIV